MGGRKPSSKGGTLDVAQVTKAVEALAKFTGKQKDASAGLLDEEDELVYLIISLRTTPAVNRKDKPVRLCVPTHLPTRPPALGTSRARAQHAQCLSPQRLLIAGMSPI